MTHGFAKFTGFSPLPSTSAFPPVGTFWPTSQTHRSIDGAGRRIVQGIPLARSACSLSYFSRCSSFG